MNIPPIIPHYQTTSVSDILLPDPPNPSYVPTQIAHIKPAMTDKEIIYGNYKNAAKFTIAEKMEFLRKNQHLTNPRLAELLGVDRTTPFRWRKQLKEMLSYTIDSEGHVLKADGITPAPPIEAKFIKRQVAKLHPNIIKTQDSDEELLGDTSKKDDDNDDPDGPKYEISKPEKQELPYDKALITMGRIAYDLDRYNIPEKEKDYIKIPKVAVFGGKPAKNKDKEKTADEYKKKYKDKNSHLKLRYKQIKHKLNGVLKLLVF